MPPKKRAAAVEAAVDAEIVYPVEDTYLSGIPHAPLTTSPAIAERLLRTGAFRAEAPEPETDPETGEPLPVQVLELGESDELVRILDHYDPPDPPPAEDAQQPEGPAEDAGPSDSPEV